MLENGHDPIDPIYCCTCADPDHPSRLTSRHSRPASRAPGRPAIMRSSERPCRSSVKALRGARRPIRTEGARRRRRQRQRLAGGRAALVRRGRDRLRAGAARSRPSSAPMPNGFASSFARPMRRRCRLPTRASTSCVSTFGVMFTPDQDRAARRDGPRLQARAARSASRTGRRRGSSASCSRRSASTFRHRPAPDRRRCGARRARLDRAVRAAGGVDQSRAAAFRFPVSLAGALAGRLQDPITDRCSRHTARLPRPSNRPSIRSC